MYLATVALASEPLTTGLDQGSWVMHWEMDWEVLHHALLVLEVLPFFMLAICTLREQPCCGVVASARRDESDAPETMLEVSIVLLRSPSLLFRPSRNGYGWMLILRMFITCYPRFTWSSKPLAIPGSCPSHSWCGPGWWPCIAPGRDRRHRDLPGLKWVMAKQW